MKMIHSKVYRSVFFVAVFTLCFVLQDLVLAQDQAKEEMDCDLFGVSVDGHRNGCISKENLLKADSLTPLTQSFRVIEFVVVFSTKETGILEIQVSGNKIPWEMKDMISRQSSGDRIWFEDIKAIQEDNEIIDLCSITLKII